MRECLNACEAELAAPRGRPLREFWACGKPVGHPEPCLESPIKRRRVRESTSGALYPFLEPPSAPRRPDRGSAAVPGRPDWDLAASSRVEGSQRPGSVEIGPRIPVSRPGDEEIPW